jgi:hypothetical protein
MADVQSELYDLIEKVIERHPSLKKQCFSTLAAEISEEQTAIFACIATYQSKDIIRDIYLLAQLYRKDGERCRPFGHLFEYIKRTHTYLSLGTDLAKEQERLYIDYIRDLIKIDGPAIATRLLSISIDDACKRSVALRRFLLLRDPNQVIQFSKHHEFLVACCTWLTLEEFLSVYLEYGVNHDIILQLGPLLSRKAMINPERRVFDYLYSKQCDKLGREAAAVTIVSLGQIDMLTCTSHNASSILRDLPLENKMSQSKHILSDPSLIGDCNFVDWIPFLLRDVTLEEFKTLVATADDGSVIVALHFKQVLETLHELLPKCLIDLSLEYAI